MAAFTCMECLAAEATHHADDWHICESCFEKRVHDHMLDMVNDGELQINADGKTMSTTAKFRARRAYERAEGEAD